MKSKKCRICSNQNLKKFLSLGTTPLANSFLTKEQLKEKEKKFPLELCFCGKCKFVQLTYIVPSEDMFSNYVYLSSTTKSFPILNRPTPINLICLTSPSIIWDVFPSLIR